jgi:hypothetical protein
MKAVVLDGMQPGPCEQIMVGPSSMIPDPALYLAHDWKHVGSEGVRRPPVCRYALGLCFGQVVRFPRMAPCAFFCASAARVRSAIWARSFSARAA